MTAESLTRFGHLLCDGNDNADTHTDGAMGVAKSGECLSVPPLVHRMPEFVAVHSCEAMGVAKSGEGMQVPAARAGPLVRSLSVGRAPSPAIGTSGCTSGEDAG
jgi:hypothetical protein